MRAIAASGFAAFGALGLAIAVGCSDAGPSSRSRSVASELSGSAIGFESVSPASVRPILPAASAQAQPVRVELPKRLGDPARIELEGHAMAVRLTLLDAMPVRGQAHAGTWLHPAGAPGGGDVVWRPTREGVEDHVSFPARPKREALRYRIELEGVAGLRLVNDTLELLDAGGAPRLRMNRPRLGDASGQTHWASVRLEGCSADSDPRAPWGRPVVSPGASRCTLVVDWSSSAVAYPALVDPAWTSTGNMANPREYHGAALLDDGRVLIAGGYAPGTLSAAELFDPTTATFAQTGSMTVARAQPGFVKLSDGRVMACGGWSQATAELYDPTSGTWTATGSMAVQRTEAFLAVQLANGKVLVAGGSNSHTTELWDPTTGAFTPTGDLNEIRYYSSAGTLLKDGRAFILGGGVNGVYSPTGEIYDPATATWSLTAPMKFGRSEHMTFLLGDGRVLVPGGVEDDAIKYSDIYDPSTDSWAPTPNLKIARRTYAGGVLKDGRVVLVGGEILFYPWYTETAEIYDPAANTWSWLSSMAQGRYAPSFTVLGDGSVLVAGGYNDLDGYLNTAQVFRFQPDGATCAIDLDCVSGHCVDGVCCATACSQLCQACSAALKTSGPDGVCGPAKAGTAEQSCAAQPGSPCGYTGACDGQGACAFAPAGTTCASKQCSAGSLASFACNGLGACTQTSVSCAPYVCGTQTSCATSCASDADCAASAWCDAGVCKPDLDAGTACNSAAQCKSGFCADGYCCDKACTGACEACSTPKTGGANGACLPVTAGTDPDDDCPDDGASSCNRDGSCDGAGACRKYAAGVECSAPGCAGNKPATFACDGNGSCAALLGADCGSYLCSGSACTTSCAGNADCAPGAQCTGGSCIPLLELGDACSSMAECASGACVDGYCCDAACDGQCEACDVQGGEGHCVPVAGQPHGSRAACSAGDPTNPCSAAACDGVERTSCQDHVGSSVTCRSASCSAGIATLAGTCDGSGQCPTPITRNCAPYQCAGDACATSCKADSDCASPAVCEVTSGKCITPSKCVDDDTVEAPNGTQSDCAPFRCENGACLTSCSSVKQCAQSYVCAASGVCQQPGAAGQTESSSGCATTPGGTSRSGLAALALLLFAGATRRRRRPGA